MHSCEKQTTMPGALMYNAVFASRLKIARGYFGDLASYICSGGKRRLIPHDFE